LLWRSRSAGMKRARALVAHGNEFFQTKTLRNGFLQWKLQHLVLQDQVCLVSQLPDVFCGLRYAWNTWRQQTADLIVQNVLGRLAAGSFHGRVEGTDLCGSATLIQKSPKQHSSIHTLQRTLDMMHQIRHNSVMQDYNHIRTLQVCSAPLADTLPAAPRSSETSSPRDDRKIGTGSESRFNIHQLSDNDVTNRLENLRTLRDSRTGNSSALHELHMPIDGANQQLFEQMVNLTQQHLEDTWTEIHALKKLCDAEWE